MSDRNNSLKTIFVIGIALALSTAFLDIAIGIVETNSKFLMFRAVLLPVMVTTGLYLLLFLGLWLLIVVRLSRALKLESISSAVAMGMLIMTVILLITVNYYSHETLAEIAGGRVLVFIGISLAAMVISYFVCRKVGRAGSGAQIGYTLSLLIPILLAETTILVWLIKNSSITAYSLSISFFITVMLTITLFIILMKLLSSTMVPLSIMALIVLIASPIAFVLMDNGLKPSADNFTESSDHDIKHIILITIDTLRTDVLSSYGSEDVKTPNIDNLASDGTRFVNAFSSAPWTLPSFASIMTGLPPAIHHTVRGDSKLPDNFKTVAEHMRDSGYYTEAIVSNFFLHPEYNMNQGFLDYNYYPKRQILIESFGARLIKSVSPDKFSENISTLGLTDLAADWIKANRDRDFFLWVHYYDPHLPYEPPLEYISQDAPSGSRIGNDFQTAGDIRGGKFIPTAEEREKIRELYNAEVRYVDDNIGRLLDTIKDLDLYNDSLIILTSDHGEEFWDHGGFEHGHSLYNELIHVPLIIKAPGARVNETIDTRVGTQSLMPTILDMTGISYDKDRVTISSLAPLLENRPADYVEQPLVSTSVLYYEDKVGVIFDDDKYIHSMVTNRDELYNLKRDPGEQSPLPISSNTDKIDQANNILKGQEQKTIELSKQLGITGGEKVKLDEEKKQKLRALDYIQ